jgi:hypothetical protein
MHGDADGFLVERDGEPDLRRRTFAWREAFFAALAAEPLRSQRASGDCSTRFSATSSVTWDSSRRSSGHAR